MAKFKTASLNELAAALENLTANPHHFHATLDVMAERARQVHVEGYTREHDDRSNDHGDMAAAAVCYAFNAACLLNPYDGLPIEADPVPEYWPHDWSGVHWKPAKDHAGARRDLVKAAALIIAEIESFDRAAHYENLRKVEGTDNAER